MIPPKPDAREGPVSLWRYARLFRNDILSAQPAKLYRAWMAEFRTPFFRSFLVNQPSLVKEVLQTRPAAFPKSDRVTEGLRPLLGDAVFVTNGSQWERQRRIIDPAFGAARLSLAFPAMLEGARVGVARLEPGTSEIEAWASHTTADIIFRTLFSIPIEDQMARAVFEAFHRYQRTQPILNPRAVFGLPKWFPGGHKRATLKAATEIRTLIGALVSRRASEIERGEAPDDLATKIMTMADPETGATFDEAEMIDQVAIFFLAGHETSAAALSWALYLLASTPEAQDRVAVEGAAFASDPSTSSLSTLSFTRDVFRETLRLYPPVPMMVREASEADTFRDRTIPKGAQIVLSPWHLHRHERIWNDPDAFRPERWQEEDNRTPAREAYLPFSSGPRVCPGAGYAMAEGVIALALAVASWRFATIPDRKPVPVAFLTTRSRNGIFLEQIQRRTARNAT
jgi:cytochrome P450